jgi:phosphatidylglycerophosphate synthase
MISSPDRPHPLPHQDRGRRRPLKARAIPVWKRLAMKLRDLGVTPNMVSVGGLLAGLGVGVALAMTSQAQSPGEARLCWGAAILAMFLRGAGNILDGVLAVECGRSTPVGHLYNEVPDRLSDVAMLVGAGYAAGGDPILGWMAAAVALFVAYVRVQVDVAGARQSFIGPMAKPMRVAVVAAAALVHLVAGDRSWLRWGAAENSGPLSAALLLVIVGGGITAIRRLLAGARELSIQSIPGS